MNFIWNKECQGKKYAFFRHTECEAFPCHAGIAPEAFNCLFCYCPLFHMKDCGGTFTRLPTGERDCSECAFVHERDNYDAVIAGLMESMLTK